jgi:hypothetical protein
MVQATLDHGTPAEHRVAVGDVVVPLVAIADTEVGLRAAGGQRRMAAPEEQLRPLRPTSVVELVAIGVYRLFQRVGEGEIERGGAELA